MSSSRMEAFSDGVLAIIITIMVLKLKPPHSYHILDIKDVSKTLIVYVLSFIYIGIYWANHHHLVTAVTSVSRRVLWANLHWLFWMSLIPFANEWIGRYPLQKGPAFTYAVVLLMCSISFNLIQGAMRRLEDNSWLFSGLGSDRRGKLSILIYFIAAIFALIYPIIAYLIFVVIAAIWVVPDMRIVKVVEKGNGGDNG